MARTKKSAQLARVRRVASFLAIERDPDAVVNFCKTTFGVSSQSAEALIKDARAELALAADIDVREELGRRKEQLEDVRERARDAGDLRVELAAIQELSKLSGVYQSSTVIDAASDAESAVASLARRHLEALGVAPKGLPLEELARLVAARFYGEGASCGNS